MFWYGLSPLYADAKIEWVAPAQDWWEDKFVKDKWQMEQI